MPLKIFSPKTLDSENNDNDDNDDIDNFRLRKAFGSTGRKIEKFA